MRTFITIIIFCIPISLLAQINNNAVDIATYKYYNLQEWSSLIKYGKQAVKNGSDFYYLNIRIAIAYYETGHFNKAEKFFLKAQAQQPINNELSKEYLFWIYLMTAREKEAYYEYSTASEELKKRLPYKKTQLIQSLTPYFAYKLSDDKSIAGDMLHAGLSTSHKLSPSIQLSSNYNYSQQKMLWGNYSQHQISFGGTYSFKKSWSLATGGTHVIYNRQLDFRTDTNWIYNGEYNNIYGIVKYQERVNSFSEWSGKSNQYFTGLHFSVQKTFGNLLVRPQIAYSHEKISNQQHIKVFTDDTVIYKQFDKEVYKDFLILTDTIYNNNTTNNNNYWQFGLNLSYTYRFNKISQINLGIELISSELHKPKIFYRPFIYGNIGRHIEYSFWYAQKNEKPIVYMNGNLFYNSHDTNKYIFSAALQFNIISKISFFINCIYSSTDDQFSQKNYKSLLGMGGIKYSF